MTIEGRITVDALIHDTAGTTDVRIISLAKSESIGSEYIAAFTSGTLADGQTASIDFNSGFKDAAGNTLTFETVSRLLFQWSGGYGRTLGGDSFSVISASGRVASSDCSEAQPLTIGAGTGTGTYSIVIIGYPI